QGELHDREGQHGDGLELQARPLRRVRNGVEVNPMTKIAGTAVACALFLGFSAPAAAQTSTDIALTRASIQKSRQTIIAGAMQFPEDEGLAFWPAYRDYRLDMAHLGDRLVKVITEFASANASLNDEQATRLLDEYLDIKAKEVAVRQ